MTIAEILSKSGKDTAQQPPKSSGNHGVEVAAQGAPKAAAPDQAPPPSAETSPTSLQSPAAGDASHGSDYGWFADLSALRRQWWDSTQANNYERGIRQSTVEKYADPVHFLYELLQNAEDQGATSVLFSLDKARLRFVHNGAPFTPQDVENITGLGNSQKPNMENKIGRFGIGFKSVFTITERPQIYTSLCGKPFSFAIENLVVPVMMDDQSWVYKEGHTLFTLPFSHEDAADIHQRIRQRLKTLGADTMLFLKNLRTIRWVTDGAEEGILRAKRDDGGANVGGKFTRLTSEVGPKARLMAQADVTYLVYSKDVMPEGGADRPLSVSIAYRMEEGRIVGEKGQATANVYFPTREKTGLRFRLHAPFLLNDSRANIKDGSPKNSAFIRACSELFAASLSDLKVRGYLTTEVLNIFPIREADFEGSPFRPMYDAMFRAARALEILPTQSGSARTHVRAAHARISDSKPLKTLLGEAQLTALYEGSMKDPVCWLHENIQKTVTPDLWNYLMRTLEVDEVDAPKVARRIDGRFLASQSDAWMTDFYAFLNDQPSLWRAAAAGRDRGPLRSKPIVRLEEGTGVAGATHVAPFTESGTPNAYLPLKTDSVGFPTVKRALLRHPETAKFFLDLGLKHPNVVDRLAQLILPRYGAANPSVEVQAYALDIREISDAVRGLPQDGAERRDLCRRLLSLNFVRAVRADNSSKFCYKRPTEVFARTPENLEWFSGNPDAWLLCPTLAESDFWAALQASLTAFSPATFPAVPSLHARPIDENGYVTITRNHGAHSRGMNGFDPAATIDGLDSALQSMTPARAKLLWHILVKNPHTIAGVVESSTTQHFGASTRTERFSALGKACKEVCWLPRKTTGEMRLPHKIRLSDLPDGWDTRSVGAKEVALRLRLTNPEEQAVADKFGVPVDALSLMIEAYKRDPRIVDQLTAMRPRPELPTTETSYTERRAEKVAREAEESPEIAFERRERSVRVSGGTAKADAEAYLREKYTNSDGQIICQICEDAMPFEREDGSPFFFSVPCLKEIENEAKQNYLALCPLCAALFQYAAWGNAPGTLRQAILREAGPRFSLTLAGKEATIWFHPHHLGDMKSVLSVVGFGRPTKF